MKAPVVFGVATAALLALSSVSMAQPSPTVVDTVIGYTSIGGNPARIDVVFSRPEGADAQAAASRALAAVGAHRDPPSIDGNPARIEVFSRPEGAGAQAAASHALSAVGAHRQPLSDDFAFLGGAWPQFFDRVRRNNIVTFNYNAAGDPTGGAALTAIQHAEQTWSSVPGSAFRYRDGGMTGRSPSSLAQFCTGAPGQLDGANDIGWCKLPAGALGVTTLVFDWRTAKVIESDVALNADISPLFWSTVTGGSEIDLEFVLLHELGHALGLAHSDDQNAVMYPYLMRFPDYVDTRRTLTTAETDGMRSLYPPHPPLQSARRSANGFQILAEMPAPGSGQYRGWYEAGGINARREVAFVADVPEGQALFVRHSGGVREIVRSGQLIGGIRLGVGSDQQVSINDSGQVVFAWFVGPPDDPFSASSAFLADGHGDVTPLVAPGAEAPGGGTFVYMFSPSISNRGEITFNATVEFGGVHATGVYRLPQRGSIEVVAKSGDPAPGGGSFTWASMASISSSGDVSFAARTTSYSGVGVYLIDGRTGELKAIARPGDVAPDGGRFEYATQPRVNSHGDVLFGGWEVGQPYACYSLYLARAGDAIERVVAPGDVMPDGWRLSSALPSWLVSWTINDSRDVAFVAWVETDPEPDPFGGPDLVRYADAIYSSHAGVLRAVARSDDVLVGVGQIYGFLPYGNVLMDNGGSVVVPVQTWANRIVLLWTGPKF
jgi:hypothetical protein